MKKFLTIGISLLFVGSSFAYTGHGFKILDTKLESSPGFNVKIEEISPDSMPVKKKINAGVTASAPNRSGKVGQFSQIDGYHRISIQNNTKTSQIYEYAYTLDCEDAHSLYVRHISLSPGGQFSTNDHQYGVVQKFYVGSFRIYATTKVSGESNASDRDSGTLTITK